MEIESVDLLKGREELRTLLKEKALEVRPITLSSGKTSDYYLDCKRVTLHPRGLFLTSHLLFDLLLTKGSYPKAVGGPTLGADPLTAGLVLVSQINHRPLAGFIIRKEAKKHGTSKWMEGIENIPVASEVVMLEDVVTTAGSSLRALEKIREQGFSVSRLLCMVNREEGGMEALAQAGVTLAAIFTGKELRK